MRNHQVFCDVCGRMISENGETGVFASPWFSVVQAGTPQSDACSPVCLAKDIDKRTNPVTVPDMITIYPLGVVRQQ